MKKKKLFYRRNKAEWLISKKQKKIYKILNCTEHLLILVSTVNGCISISAFASLVGITVGIASFVATIKIW